MSYSDFQLPGLKRTPNGISRWIVSTAWAYSMRWNNRRLENHFHGIWNIVLHDLTDDLAPYVFVVPQYQIDSIGKAPAAPNRSTDTAAKRDATELTPDFSVVMTLVVPRHITQESLSHHLFVHWNEFKIKWFIAPLFAELKRSPSRRCSTLEVFCHELNGLFDEAVHGLENQVENGFAMQPKGVNQIILLACVGEWWSWKVAERHCYVAGTDLMNNILGDIEEFENAGSPKGPRKLPPRGSKTALNRRKCFEPDDESDESDITFDKLPYNPCRKGEGRMPKRSAHPIHYTELGSFEEQLEENVENAMPPEHRWSNFIRLGSPASNQRLFLIHRFLSTDCMKILNNLVS